MDATFRYEIGQKSIDLFEKVLKQFEIEDEAEESYDYPSESALNHTQSMGTMTVTTRHKRNQEVMKKTKLKKQKFKDLNMLEHKYT